MSQVRWRGKLLGVVGGSWLMAKGLSGACGKHGVRVRRVAGGLDLSRDGKVVRLLAKHAFFAPLVCKEFETFAAAMPPAEIDGQRVADYRSSPEIFNMCRSCLREGVRIAHRGNEVWLHKDHRAMVLSERHFVYAIDMSQRFELYFSPLVPELRDGVEVLDYSRPGTLQTYKKSGLQFEMASFPEEDEAIEEYFRWYRPKAGDLVFDMGAHCGVSTYHFSKMVGPQGKVVCFEPDPINFAILTRNIERHGLTNVVAENAAIAGKTGQLAFNSEGTIGSSLVSLLSRESAGETTIVDAYTLSDVFERFGVPDFCKIDIEGAEVETVASAGDLLRGKRTNFALDTNHPKANGETTDKEVEEAFRSFGYEVKSEANPCLTTWARPK